MNIIQISEQLKDVPDQFLMKEIQNPTGSYPSYLVVSELTRRKRMRDGAIKQEPTTSVAEDLVGISGTPQAGQSTLGAAQQMMAQQMPQQMPEMGVNVPEMGMNQTPMMAGGGLVAFENGGPIRAQEGMYTGDYRPSAFERFVGFNLFQPPAGAPTGVTGDSLTDRAEVAPSALSRLFPDDTEKMLRMVEQQRKDSLAAQMEPFAGSTDPGYIQPTQSPVATGAPTAQPPAATPGAVPGLGAFKMPEFPTAQYEAAMGMPMPTEAEIAGLRKRAGEELEGALPDRTSELLNERILRKTEQLQKDKDMSFNEALFAAGAAILSAPGGGGMKWAGEGLKAFGQTMAEGKKDVRRSQDLIDQANIDLAQAQSLRDQGKLNAADKAENKAFERFAQGRALAQSDAALSLQQFNAQITAAKAPFEMAETGAKAGYYRAAANVAGQPKAKAIEAPSFGEVMAFKSAYLSEYPKATKEQVEAAVQNQYPGYRPMLAPEPIIRGAGSPATLPGT